MAELIAYAGVEEYLAETEKFLLEREVVNNLILGICYDLRKTPGADTDFSFFSAIHKKQVMATCIISRGSILLSAATYQPGDLKLILQGINQRSLKPITLFGENLYVDIFSEMFHARGKSNYYKLLKLEKLNHYKQKDADFQPAKKEDEQILINYLIAYETEISALKRRTPEALALVTRNLIEAGKLYVLRVGADIVCMAAILRETKNYGIIGNVYTPVPFRKQGFGGFCVGRLTALILKDFKGCALFTDKLNDGTNLLYEGLGFTPVAEFTETEVSIDP